jgi:hypothetical protein
MNPLPFRLSILGSALLYLGLFQPAFAARPPAAKLLPQNTVLLVSTPDVRELSAKFMNTNFGRMIQDPQLKPLIEQVYGSLGEAVAKAKDKIGLSLSELLAIYQGEITFAVVAPKDAGPEMVLLLDAGEQIGNARKLLEKGMEALERSGGRKREETVGDAKVTVFENAGPRRRGMVFFEKDATLVSTTSLDVAKDLLAAWEGGNRKPLSENPQFATVMSRCCGSQDEEPQIIAFFDLVNFLRCLAVDQPQIRLFLAMMPALGLDGLSGVGGSVLFDERRFDAVYHLHVAMESPRSGILKLISFQPGPTKPEYWVPADVAQYATFHWEFQEMWKSLSKLVDSFSGEGTLARLVENRFLGPIGVDLQKDILPALQGRVTYLQWIEKPITERSQQSLIALKLKDVKKIEEVLQKIEEHQKNPLSKVSYAGKTFYQIQFTPPPNVQNPEAFPVPCFGIVDDYLVVANQPALYKQVLVTAESGEKSLGDEPDFKLVMSQIERICGGAQPALISFERDDESLRFSYEVIQSKRTREGLQRMGENNPFFRSLQSALENNPLPPFEVLQKYLASGGAVILDDETGIHYMNFTLKRKAEED